MLSARFVVSVLVACFLLLWPAAAQEEFLAAAEDVERGASALLTSSCPGLSAAEAETVRSDLREMLSGVTMTPALYALSSVAAYDEWTTGRSYVSADLPHTRLSPDHARCCLDSAVATAQVIYGETFAQAVAPIYNWLRELNHL